MLYLSATSLPSLVRAVRGSLQATKPMEDFEYAQSFRDTSYGIDAQSRDVGRCSAASEERQDSYTHQAPGHHLPGEYFIRSLFRNLSCCGEPVGRTVISRRGRHTHSQRSEQRASREESEPKPAKSWRRDQPFPLGPIRCCDKRPGSRLHAGATGLRRRLDGPLSAQYWNPWPASRRTADRRYHRPGNGLLRRKHRHGTLELRAALRHE